MKDLIKDFINEQTDFFRKGIPLHSKVDDYFSEENFKKLFGSSTEKNHPDNLTINFTWDELREAAHEMIDQKAIHHTARKELALHLYLTAPFGKDFCLVLDEDDDENPVIYSVIDQNHILPENAELVARIPCPGHGNLDMSDFEADFAEMADDGTYYEISSGRPIGDTCDLNWETINEGDVTAFHDELEDKLLQAAADRRAMLLEEADKRAGI